MSRVPAAGAHLIYPAAALLALACATAPAPVPTPRPGIGPTAQPKRLAVLEFEVAKGISIDRVYFSDEVRGAVVARAPQLFVMTRESEEVLLKASGGDLAACAGECEIETGRMLGADYVVSGRITQVGTRLLLSLRLHSTAEARLLRAAEAKGKSADELVDSSKPAIADLLAALAPPKTPAPNAQQCRDPGGSYAQTCRDVVVRGCRLTAQCQRASGMFTPASVDLSGCTALTNCDGRLVCGRGCQ